MDAVPVSLLSGFLGAGKTTLVNRILAERHGERIAVVVNEFGDVPIDGRLVVNSDEEVVELANGCVCCTIRGDLVRTLHDLLRRRQRRLFRQPFERVLIETSGLASPGPILQTLVVEPELARALRSDGVLTLVHAGLIARQMEEHPEAAEQVGYADRLLLNHLDRVDAAERAAAVGLLRRTNAVAPIVAATRADYDVAELLDLGDVRAPEPAPGDAAVHTHTHGAGTVVLTSTTPLDLHRLKMWLQFLANRRGQEIWRMKGILRCVDHPTPVVVQAVYQWLELGPGAGAPPECSTLVLIGRDLDRDELERGFEVCRVD